MCGVTPFLAQKEHWFREVKYLSETLSSRTLIFLIPKPMPLLKKPHVKKKKKKSGLKVEIILFP